MGIWQTIKAKFSWLFVYMMAVPLVGGWISDTPLHVDAEWLKKLHVPFRASFIIVIPIGISIRCLMGLSSYIVVVEDIRKAAIPILIYGLQLIVGWSAIYSFLIWHEFLLTIILSVVVLLMQLVCAVMFFRINQFSGYLWVPIISWTIYRLYQNGYIYFNN